MTYNIIDRVTGEVIDTAPNYIEASIKLLGYLAARRWVRISVVFTS